MKTLKPRKKQADKGIILKRQAALAKEMLKGNGYADDYAWYFDFYGLTEKSFQHDRTIIYRQWKIDDSKEMSEKKIEYLNSLKSDRQLARDSYNPAAAIQATKLMAQIDGVLNKQNESVINISNNIIGFEEVSTDDLLKTIEELKKLKDDKKN